MGEGTQTPVPIAQCPACQEQDIIEIAGKKFCSNCGTPQTSSNAGVISSINSSAPASASAPSASAGPVNDQAATKAVPGLSTDAHTPSVATNQMSTAPLSEPMPSTGTPQPQATSSASGSMVTPTASPATNASETADTDAPTEIKLRPKAEELHNAMQADTSSSIQKFSAQADSSSAASAGSDTSLSEDTPGNAQGNEMSSLSDKADESVMSDAALDELAKTNDDPVEAGDVVVPTNLPVAPAAEAASTNAATPLQSSYKLDLTQPQGQSSTLPKAVSDIRPGGAQPPQAQSTVATPTPPPAAPAAPTTGPFAPASTPVAPAAPVASAITNQPASMPASSVASTVTPSATVGAQPASSALGAMASAPVTASTDGMNLAAVADNNAAATTASQPASGKGVRLGSVALSLVGLFLVGAYIWQVNYPNLALKVAASKAGISANFPGYVPNGWKLNGNIQSSPGNISYNLANTQADKSLAVTESKTDWDSQALAENYVAPKSSNYLALQAQGLTIYLYDGNQASWVNNGTWYRIEGKDHGLTQDQVIKLATSL